MDPIVERIREILQKHGWSERELSDRAGLSPAHVGKILERGGERVGAETLSRLAAAAGVSLDWLITGRDPVTNTASEPTSRPVYRNLPGWAEAVTVVRRTRPYIPLQALEAAGETNALVVTGPVMPEMIIRQANTWLDNADPDLLEQLDAARVRSEIAAAESRYDRALAQQQELRERGDPVPHVLELMRRLERAERRALRATAANESNHEGATSASTTVRKGTVTAAKGRRQGTGRRK